jgi:hypothetical protein
VKWSYHYSFFASVLREGRAGTLTATVVYPFLGVEAGEEIHQTGSQDNSRISLLPLAHSKFGESIRSETLGHQQKSSLSGFHVSNVTKRPTRSSTAEALVFERQSVLSLNTARFKCVKQR